MVFPEDRHLLHIQYSVFCCKVRFTLVSVECFKIVPLSLSLCLLFVVTRLVYEGSVYECRVVSGGDGGDGE